MYKITKSNWHKGQYRIKLNLSLAVAGNILEYAAVFFTGVVPFVVYTLGDMLISKYIDWKYSLLIMIQPRNYYLKLQTQKRM